jgi:tetraprenyl-beta-curcumene synthase
VLVALGRYEGSIRPRVRRELAGWRHHAGQVPDPALRAAALGALTEKAANVEAVAVFATLAPRRGRAAVVRAIVALQAAIDYLDLLGEQPGPDPLADGLRLHAALGTGFSAGAGTDESHGEQDWYSLHPHGDDGGYLDALLRACRESFAALPSSASLGAPARAAALRCGTGQSHTHAAAAAGPEELRAWAEKLPAPPGYRWWELAAGACSSVAAHALIALAAEPGASIAEAGATEAAYFPATGALTVLLDDLIDREADARAGEHSYLDYYASAEEAGKRLAWIHARADEAIAPLPRAARHRAILTGVLAFYLSSPAAGTPLAEPTRMRLLAAAGPAVGALASLLRLRG